MACAAAIVPLDPWLALLGTILLLSASAEVLIPTRFELTEQGVRLRSIFRSVDRDWDRFGGWQSCTEGFWLRGRTRSRLLQRRGAVRLSCPGREEAVSILLRQKLGEPGGLSS